MVTAAYLVGLVLAVAAVVWVGWSAEDQGALRRTWASWAREWRAGWRAGLEECDQAIASRGGWRVAVVLAAGAWRERIERALVEWWRVGRFGWADRMGLPRWVGSVLQLVVLAVWAIGVAVALSSCAPKAVSPWPTSPPAWPRAGSAEADSLVVVEDSNEAANLRWEEWQAANQVPGR